MGLAAGLLDNLRQLYLQRLEALIKFAKRRIFRVSHGCRRIGFRWYGWRAGLIGIPLLRLLADHVVRWPRAGLAEAGEDLEHAREIAVAGWFY